MDDDDPEEHDTEYTPHAAGGGGFFTTLFFIGASVAVLACLCVAYRRWQRKIMMHRRSTGGLADPTAGGVGGYFVGGYRKLYDETDGTRAEFV